MKKIVVVGKGTMGLGVSRLFKRLDLTVLNISLRNQQTLSEKDRNFIRDADLILECVVEDKDIKLEVLSLCSKENKVGVIATCTSSISINELQVGIKNSSRFIGIHFMNPPLLIPYVEVIEAKSTSKSTSLHVVQWLTSLGRKISLVPDSPGFALNAILFSMLNRAAYSIQEQEIEATTIDQLFAGVCGHKLGPLATLDLIGLDVSLTILRNLYERNPVMNLPPAQIIENLVSAGHLGKKTKRGFYTY